MIQQCRPSSGKVFHKQGFMIKVQSPPLVLPSNLKTKFPRNLFCDKGDQGGSREGHGDGELSPAFCIYFEWTKQGTPPSSLMNREVVLAGRWCLSPSSPCANFCIRKQSPVPNPQGYKRIP
ncbi:hypothetical protein H6P81_020350 [Aristolochia fimbriata]|uniref:Uncharacterized protein n=1 Tax=Aristolochia fimbriata TaxID=158543 RepID=A0AAV7DW23_ARIFI|nr:hypothetical protein H6P81_020350 [Aristolochia fimbriata]